MNYCKRLILFLWLQTYFNACLKYLLHTNCWRSLMPSYTSKLNKKLANWVDSTRFHIVKINIIVSFSFCYLSSVDLLTEQSFLFISIYSISALLNDTNSPLALLFSVVHYNKHCLINSCMTFVSVFTKYFFSYVY